MACGQVHVHIVEVPRRRRARRRDARSPFLGLATRFPLIIVIRPRRRLPLTRENRRCGNRNAVTCTASRIFTGAASAADRTTAPPACAPHDGRVAAANHAARRGCDPGSQVRGRGATRRPRKIDAVSVRGSKRAYPFVPAPRPRATRRAPAPLPGGASGIAARTSRYPERPERNDSIARQHGPGRTPPRRATKVQAWRRVQRSGRAGMDSDTVTANGSLAAAVSRRERWAVQGRTGAKRRLPSRVEVARREQEDTPRSAGRSPEDTHRFAV
jgi:hypothetical protein